MKWSILLLLFVLVPSALGVVDEFAQAGITEQINEMPAEFMAMCKAETTAGLDYIEKKVDSRLELFPVYIGVSAGLGVIAGYMVGSLLLFSLTRRVAKLQNKTSKELISQIKELKRLQGGK